MAKLQTLASRAEAASAMAEAEIALQSLKTAAAPQAVPETGQATQLLQQSTAEFNKRNYGGAPVPPHHGERGGGARPGGGGGGGPGGPRPGGGAFAVPPPLLTA